MGKLMLLSLSFLLLFAATDGLRSISDILMGSESRGLREEGSTIHVVSKERGSKKDDLMEIYATGSSLPDCSHACGPCFPCKRVMVSFKCSVAESCPIVYRCMCRGKYYHVPSN